MKKLIAACMSVWLVSTGAQADDWFDMKNCDVCRPMAKHMDLMSEIKWETHMLPNGFLSISVVPKKHEETMAAAHAEMEQAIARAETGEKMELCGHCQSWGKLLSMGAKKQELDTVGGHITLLTSDDSEVVKEIQAHAKRSLAEFDKLSEASPSS